MEQIKYIASGCHTIDTLPRRKCSSVLVALPDAMKSKKTQLDTAEMADQSDQFYLDSGGRQIFMATTGQHSKYHHFKSIAGEPIIAGKTLNIHIEHIAEAIELFKPAYVMGLDFPVRPSQDPNEQERRFRETIEQNITWACDSIRLRDKYYPQTKIILPLQAQSIDNLRTYWKQIKYLNCDGVGIPMRLFKNDLRLIETLIEFRKLGIKDIHFLGTSRLGAIIIGAYFVRNKSFSSVTMDSCTWRKAADIGKIIVPYDLREVHPASEKEKLKERIARLPAIWREKINSITAYTKGREEHRALREFNYRSIESTINDIEKHAASTLEMQEFLLDRSTRVIDIHKIIHRLSDIEARKSLSSN